MIEGERIPQYIPIYIYKAIAVLSIVSAHVSGIITDKSSTEIFCARLLSSWGTFGVPVFLMLSGFLYEISMQRHDINYIFCKKMKSLVLPWILSGTVVWFYVVLRKGNVNFAGWVNFIAGNGSYLYYMTILLVLYMIYPLLRKKNIYIYAGILIWVIDNVGIYVYGWRFNFSIYLNFVSWQGWFLLGGLYSKNTVVQERIKRIIKNRIIVILCPAVAVIWTMVVCYKGMAITYWDRRYIALELLMLPVLEILNQFIKEKKIGKIIKYVGQNAFSIYLIHMPIAGIIANIFNRFNNGPFIFIRPILVILISMSVIKFLEIICRKYDNLKIIELMIGKSAE